MQFSTVSFHSCRIIFCRSILVSLVILLGATSVFAESPNGVGSLAAREDKKGKERIKVVVKGIKDPLLSNVYNRLAIYRLRSHPRLQKVSVYQLFRQAEDDIKQALAPFGYYHPEIDAKITLLTRSQQGKEMWKVSFVIDRGLPVIISEVELICAGEGRNNKVLNKQLRSFGLKKGDILNQQIYEREKKQLINAALGEGYLNAGFSESELRIDPARNIGSIRLHLDSGDRFQFGTTTIMTNPPGGFRDSLLQGYLPWKEGDPYSVAKLFKLQSILYGAEYFTTQPCFDILPTCKAYVL